MLLDAWRQDAPQDPYVHCRMGRIHEHFRRKEEASQEYRTALSKDPKCYEAAFALARLIAEQKRIEEAFDYYRLCLELPHPVPAQVGMAGCLKSLGRANEARMLLEEAVQFSDHERAAAYKAVGEAPEQFVAATELGKLYSESGDHAKGAVWLGRAVEFNPRDLVARYALAGALRGLGYLEDAEQQFNIVRTARKALEQASNLNDQVEAHPTDVDARYRLGKILLDYDSERKGLFYLRSVLTYNPNHEPTLSLLRDHESKSPMERLAALGGSAGLPREIASKANSVNIRSSTDKSKRPSRETPGSGPPPMDFVDATQRSGLQFTYHNGVDAGERSILESLGGGVGVWDYDRDGWPDLCFAGGGRLGPEKVISGLPTGLWRGVGPMRFQDVSTIAGVARSDYFTHGIAVGDYDNDGFEDLLITGYGGLQLYRNHGDGTFTQATLATGLTDTLWSTSACWADFNGDGNLDLFAAHYVDWSWKRHPKCPGAIPGTFDVCAPREFNPLPDVVYFSNGDGTFHDASEFAGLDPGGKGLGVVAADVDNDGDTDVYVANDTDNNFLYVNDGQGRFRESGFVSGTAVDHRGIPNGSMGIAVFDYDQDLALDIWVTNFENETFALYRNERDEASFVCVSESTGITVLQKLLVGFGTVCGDFDLDGDEDIIVANGHVMYHPKNGGGAQEAVVLSNDGRGHFQQLQFSPDGFFGQKHWGRGLAASDLDRDGDLDLVFALNNEPAAIVANETNVASQSLTVRLFGTVSNRNGIGARAVLDTSHGQYLRSVCGGGSYLSQPEFQMFWGIPAGSVLHGLTVYWPSGTVQKVEVSAPGTRSLIEPITGT
ncbi:MAG: VCBS repeat-containing protein, partial [Planctomycetia bacterium]|nr:VCBS repeat-containing protein [Planctomycetia bacterium]